VTHFGVNSISDVDMSFFFNLLLCFFHGISQLCSPFMDMLHHWRGPIMAAEGGEAPLQTHYPL